MKQKNSILLLSLIMAGGMALSSCMDNNYDLGDLDQTVALGSSTLELPVNNSLKDVLLEDLLEIGESESVTIDANGVYHFEESSSIDDVNEINVDKITLAKAGDPIENPVVLEGVEPFPAIVPEGTEGNYTGAPISDQIETFNYTSDAQSSVVDLEKAALSGNMELDVYFSSKLRQVVETIDEMYIEVPPFMEFDVISMSANAALSADNDHRVVFTNQKTDDHAQLKIHVKELDFAADKNTDATNCLKFNKEAKTVSMVGKVNVYANISKVKKRTIADDGYADAAIRSTLTINDIVVESATGKFSPDINIENSTVELNDLPDFLTDEKVKADLYNPQIIFTANSNLPLNGTISAKLTAKKNGNTIKTIDIDPFNLTNGANKICISRRSEDIPSDATQTIIEPELSELISVQMPDVIDLEINAEADSENSYEILLGKNYTVTDISYSIQAPLAFGEKAVIVYNDTIDGWAADMPEDLDFEKGAYIEVNGIMESNIPAYLKLDVKAIDVNKKEIDNVTVDISSNVKGSGDGSYVATPITVIIREKDVKGALKQVDGVHLILDATSSENGSNPIVGQPLNATQNKLKIHDVKVTIHGRIIADLN